MNKRKLLNRLLGGSLQNVAFGDFVNLIMGLGFVLRRVSGSHHVFGHPDIPEMVNIQNVAGQAKPYQIRQFLRLVERYNMRLENDE